MKFQPVKISGGEFEARLAALSYLDRSAAIRAALNSAAQLLQSEQRDAAPITKPGTERRGALRKSVTRKITVKPARMTATIGPRLAKGSGGHLARLIVRSRRIVTSTGKDTGRMTTPNPFIAEAASRSMSRAKAKLLPALVKHIEAMAVKNG